MRYSKQQWHEIFEAQQKIIPSRNFQQQLNRN